jgi:hypothetical protein
MNTTDVTELNATEAANVRREARRATYELIPQLLVRYDELRSDNERREFFKTHREVL